MTLPPVAARERAGKSGALRRQCSGWRDTWERIASDTPTF